LCAALYLFTSSLLWKTRDPRLFYSPAQAAAYLWDVAVITALLYASEGFDLELYLMLFLIMFIAGLMRHARHAALVGTVTSLVYAGLWQSRKAGVVLPVESLLVRISFFYAFSFFAAITAERVRAGERRLRGLQLRFALKRIANGGWGQEDPGLAPSIDPDTAQSLRTINALIDNLTTALNRTVEQNEQLRETAGAALLQLAREKERLGAVTERAKEKP
jgi:hypothetical protein